MTLTDIVIQKVIVRLLQGQDYRTEILALINASFLQYVIEFFGKVAEAKLKNQSIDGDWYKREFLLAPGLTTNDIIINAGLNTKTVSNQFKSASRKVVLEVAPEHYDELYKAISTLASQSDEIDLTLTIKFRGVSVDLNITESLIVINTLAVKRAQLRDGAWSSVGKRVEKYLMLTLCHLHKVPDYCYELKGRTTQEREVDFFLVNPATGKRFSCEVKLMGKGNPESADAVIARDSDVFVADTLSMLNKQQLTTRKIQWVELRDRDGYKQFLNVLNALGIPAQPFTGDLDSAIETIFEQVFPHISDETVDIPLDDTNFDPHNE